MFAKVGAALLLLLIGASVPISARPAPATDQAAWAAQCKDWDDWDKAGPPFRVFGNTYYVGTCGISAILVADDKQLVLIDSGTEPGAGVVLANIRALGFDPANVVALLNSHEHYDHVGGIALLQKATGAPLITSPAAQDVFRTGQPGSDDPQAGMHEPMTPVPDVHAMQPEVPYLLPFTPFHEGGDNHLFRAVDTPGHTPGAVSWQWHSCEAGLCKTIVYADSLSPVSSDTYRFSDHPAYVAAFRESLAKIASLDCDILLSPHPSASGMRDKLLKRDLSGAPHCKEYAEGLGKQLDERLAKEAAQ